MENTLSEQVVKPSYTSDGEQRSNLMTRDEFLRRVLYSGEVTRISQHLAVVIFLVAEGRNQLNISVRDLERITGWSRTAIKDHLTELEVFMKVIFGGGRAKALFELQGVIEDALATAVVAGSRPPKVATNVMAAQPATSVVASQVATSGVVATSPATTLVASQAAIRSVMASQPAANGLVAGQVAASLLASVAATSPVMASQVDTTPPPPIVVASQVATNSPTRERERELDNKNLSLSATTPRDEADPIQLNGVAIYGPDFKLSYASIDQAAFLIGMPSDRARKIAEIHARDWAMNGKRPDYPMAMIRKLLKNDLNEGQVQEIKIEKARGDAAPKESRAARLLRQVESAAEKGGKR